VSQTRRVNSVNREPTINLVPLDVLEDVEFSSDDDVDDENGRFQNPFEESDIFEDELEFDFLPITEKKEPSRVRTLAREPTNQIIRAEVFQDVDFDSL